MKLVVYEPDSKPFQHSRSTSIGAEITEDDEILQEEQNGNLLGLNAHEKETPDRNYFISMDSLRNGKLKLLEGTVLYTDKSVTECKQPELIVCYKESLNPHMKDICIDDGVLSTNVIWFENGNEEEECSCIDDNFQHSYTEEAKLDPCGPEEWKSSEVNHCNNVTITDKVKTSTENGHANQNDDETRNDAKDVIEGDNLKEKLLPENRLLEQDLESSKINDNEVDQDSTQIPNGDSISLMPTMKFAAEGSNLRSSVEELSYDSKVESGSITFHFDSSTPIDLETPIECPNAFIPGDDSSDDHQNVSSRVQRDHMECSFAPVSGLITYSGHITYSGSLSHRSDTSGATSTRSFAFPILDTEWISSPVKMAEAERRPYGKHRGWRMGLLCCRF